MKLENNKNGLPFIIQARVGSTRLPQKMTLPFFDNSTVFEIIIKKLQRNFTNNPIIIATSDSVDNDVLASKATLLGCKVFRGRENDVLNRFCEAAKFYGVSRMIRICADNPFIDVPELRKLLLFVENDTFDYVSFKVNGIPSIKTHFGFWAEYVTLKTLLIVEKSTQEIIFHEHVTNFIYEHEDLFKVAFLEPNPIIINQEDVRMTLDTLNDFNLLSYIYREIYNQNGVDFGINEIFEYLSNNPEFKKLMSLEINKNLK